jgi:DNA-binding PadR family transcriptional regulator
MVRRARANPLALAVLVLLYERPMHPYEMSSTLRERRKEDSIKLNYGSLYAVVESLQKRGFITTQEVIRDGRRPERTIYAITDTGATEMTDWLSDLVAHPIKEFTQFEAALSLLAILPPDDAIELLATRLRLQVMDKQAQDTLLAQARESNFPRLFLIEGEYKQALLNAEIEFIRELLDDFRTGKLAGMAMWRRLSELRDTGLTPDEINAALADEFSEEFRLLELLGKPPER